MTQFDLAEKMRLSEAAVRSYGLGGSGLEYLKSISCHRYDSELPAMAISIIDFANICEAVDYFFRSGDDFNREREGELNETFSITA